MIGRTLVRIPVRSRLIRPASQCQHDPVARLPLVLSLRTYATPGRPKSVVGEPSKPVKRAVKKAAAKPPTGGSPAEKQVAANKRKASQKAKTPKKKEPTPEQKERAQRREAKKQERLEKEKAAKQTRRAKLKEKEKANAAKQQIKDLKEAALSPPRHRQFSAYTVFFAEKAKEHDLAATGGNHTDQKAKLAKFSQETGAQWRNLSAADLEHYNHLANTKREEHQAEYKKWVESHSADEIQRANAARSMLRRRLEKDRGKYKRSKWADIHDERAVKRPLNPYAQFVVNRNASGDFKNISIPERGRLIAQEWKALNEQEKKKYQNLGAQEVERYATEYKDVYGHEQPHAAAAAA